MQHMQLERATVGMVDGYRAQLGDMPHVADDGSDILHVGATIRKRRCSRIGGEGAERAVNAHFEAVEFRSYLPLRCRRLRHTAA